MKGSSESQPPALPSLPVSASPPQRRWLLLALLALLLVGGAVGGALWWSRKSGPPGGTEAADNRTGQRPGETAVPRDTCSDDADPKYLEPLAFGPPLETRLDRRLLDALPERPIPEVEVYPWQPEGLVAVLGEHRMRGDLVAARPDGSLLAVAVGGGTFVRVGPVKTLHEGLVLTCPGGVVAMSWAVEGPLAVSCGDGVVRLFDIRDLDHSPEPRMLERATGPITSLSFSGDGKYLIGGENRDKTASAWVWQVASAKVIHKLKHTGPVQSVAFSPVPGDYRALSAGGAEDSKLRLWDAAAGTSLSIIDFTPPKKTETSSVGRVAFSPDGKRVLSCHPDQSVRVWDLARFEKGKELHAYAGHAGLPIAAFTPDGRHVVTARFADGGLWLWEAGQAKQVRRLAVADAVGSSLAFLSDGQLVYAGFQTNAWNVHLHELETGKELRPPQGHLRELTGVALAPQGHQVASLCNDNQLRLWDLDDLKLRHVVPAMGGSLGYHPDGKRVFYFCPSLAPLAFVDAESGKPCTPAYNAQHAGGLLSAAITRDGRYAVTGGYHDGTVRMWRLQDGRQVRHFDLGKDQGYAVVTLAPDMRRALRLGGNKLRLLHLRCQQVKHEWPPAAWAPFLPDGRAVFFGGAESPTWKVAGDSPREAGPLPFSLAGVGPGQVSADGRRVAAILNGQVAVYQLDRKQPVWQWKPPVHFGVAGVTLSPDAGHLLTANADGTAYIVRLP